MQTQRNAEELIVPLRLSPSWLLSPILGVLLGLVCVLPYFILGPTYAIPRPGIWIFLSLSVLLSTPLFLYVFYRCRARLILTERGLRWRTWGDWRQTTWDGVRDYYDQPQKKPDDISDKLMSIKTDTGTITLSRRWPESGSIREVVQERAQQVEEKSWGIRGERIGDMNLYFYDQSDFWPGVLRNIFLMAYTLWGWHWTLTSPLFTDSPKKTLTTFWSPDDFWGSLVMTILSVLLMLGWFCMLNLPLLLVIATVPGMANTRRRRAERITTSRDGITYEDGQGPRITATWQEVTGYFIGPSSQSKSRLLRATAFSSNWDKAWRWSYTVETKQGDFQYTSFISDSEKLGKTFKENGIELQGRDLDQVK